MCVYVCAREHACVCVCPFCVCHVVYQCSTHRSVVCVCVCVRVCVYEYVWCSEVYGNVVYCSRSVRASASVCCSVYV